MRKLHLGAEADWGERRRFWKAGDPGLGSMEAAALHCRAEGKGTRCCIMHGKEEGKTGRLMSDVLDFFGG